MADEFFRGFRHVLAAFFIGAGGVEALEGKRFIRGGKGRRVD